MCGKSSVSGTRAIKALQQRPWCDQLVCLRGSGSISRRYFSRLADEQVDDDQVKTHYDLQAGVVVLTPGETAVHLPVGVLAL